MKALVRLVRDEEKRIMTEEKHQNMIRRERIHEYEKLLTVDKTRRKLGKAEAAATVDHQTRLKIRHETDQAALHVREMVEEHKMKILRYQRKHQY